MRTKYIVPTLTRNPIDSSITLNTPHSKCSLIWLHGLGATAESFVSAFSHSQSPLYEGVRIKLIQAPLRPVTINMGQISHSWYDLKSLQRFTQPQTSVFDWTQVEDSLRIINQHVFSQMEHWQEEIQHDIQHYSPIIPIQRIFIGGFSQGGVMALHYSLTSSQIPAGVIALSSYLFRSTPLLNFRKLPICLMHGDRDDVIKESEAVESYQRILQDQNLVSYQTIKNLDHSLNLRELAMMKLWFQDVNGFIEKHYKTK